MKVNRCESPNFYGIDSPEIKKRIITPEMQKFSKILLEKMNNGTKYVENEDKTSFTSNILASLNIGEKIKFSDDRLLLYKTTKPKEYPNLCTLKMGKNKISMNSDSGEILRYDKSIFKTWSSLFKQAERYLKEFVESFDEPSIVKKNFFGISELTKKGYKILQEVQNKIYNRNV